VPRAEPGWERAEPRGRPQREECGLINFWLKDKGLEIVAVNANDSADVINQSVKEAWLLIPLYRTRIARSPSAKGVPIRRPSFRALWVMIARTWR
jgi:hypothetical protein